MTCGAHIVTVAHWSSTQCIEGEAVNRGTAGTGRREAERTFVRRGLLLGLVLVLALMGVAPAAQAKSHKKKAKAKPVTVSFSVVPRTRTTLMTAGATRVKVKASGKVSVSFKDASGLSKSGKLSFTKKGTKSLSLKLSDAGRAALAKCGAQSITFKVTGTYTTLKSSKSKKKVKKKVTKSSTTKWTGAACPPVVKPVDCDPIGTGAAHCLLPFPDDYYTKADPSSQTGRRINFTAAQMPADKKGKHIDPTEWNYNDGFSPGQAIVVKVPGMDNQAAFANTGLVPITNIADYTRADQPAVVIDAQTGARQMIWAELDTQPGVTDAQRTLIIRPGKNWLEGHHYIVALRNMKNAAGQVLQPNAAFKAFRDGTVPNSASAAIKARKAALETDFTKLNAAGVSRSSLYLAWDFTIASEKSLSGRFLAMRDNAFHQLGDDNLADGVVQGHAPAFTVSSVEAGDGTKIWRTVKGTFDVPCYTTKPGCAPGGVLNYGGDTSLYRTPKQLGGTNILKATYTCRIPVDSDNPGHPVTDARGVIYGHGLLGSQSEVNSGKYSDVAYENKMVYCATDWYGMASADVIPAVAPILGNLTNMPKLPDNVQEGMLAFDFLGRLLAANKAQGGFASNPAFQDAGTPADPGTDATHTSVNEAAGRMYYDGNSQGGIIGGAVMATIPDATRGTLGVLGMNYSTLLQRSTDFSNYAQILYANYTDLEDRQVLLGVMQMLWDRGEANGYAEHMTTDPYPNTPQHAVMLHAAFGDHQVSNWSALVEARTIGAKLYTPDGVPDDALDAGRWSPVVNPFLGIDPIPNGGFPYKGGSVLVFFDSGPARTGPSITNSHGTFTTVLGTNMEPLSNNAPVSAPDTGDITANLTPANWGDGDDPHEYPRQAPGSHVMKNQFDEPDGTSQVPRACGATQPCYSDHYKTADVTTP
jgi:hypothetical protein